MVCNTVRISIDSQGRVITPLIVHAHNVIHGDFNGVGSLFFLDNSNCLYVDSSLTYSFMVMVLLASPTLVFPSYTPRLRASLRLPGLQI